MEAMVEGDSNQARRGSECGVAVETLPVSRPWQLTFGHRTAVHEQDGRLTSTIPGLRSVHVQEVPSLPVYRGKAEEEGPVHRVLRLTVRVSCSIRLIGRLAIACVIHRCS